MQHLHQLRRSLIKPLVVTPVNGVMTVLVLVMGSLSYLTEYYFLYDKYSEIFGCEDGEPPVSLEEAKDIFNQLFGESK